MNAPKRTPFFTDARTAKLFGWTLFVAGALALYDAYDGRGGKCPWPLSAVMPF